MSLLFVCVLFAFALHTQTAKRMPGMSLRESDKGSDSESRGDGSTVSDGYSSKSVTTTHGIRSVHLLLFGAYHSLSQDVKTAWIPNTILAVLILWSRW